MTGTGTQADPFIIESWNEFKAGLNTSVVSGSDTYYKIPDNTVWDLNELEPTGCPTITIAGGTPDGYRKVIDGNGIIIKNIHNNAGNCFIKYSGTNCPIIQNFNFENCYCNGSLIYQSSSYIRGDFMRFELQDCTITGIFSNQIFEGGHQMHRRFNLFRCGIKAEITGNAPLSYKSGLYIVDSNIDIKWTSNTLPNKMPNDWYNIPNDNSTTYFNNSLVKFDMSNNTNDNTRLALATNTDATYDIYTFKMNTGTITFPTSGGGSVSLITTDYLSDSVTYTNATTKWYNRNDVDWKEHKFVTEEQLKDASYLRSLGFPIGVD